MLVDCTEHAQREEKTMSKNNIVQVFAWQNVTDVNKYNLNKAFIIQGLLGGYTTMCSVRKNRT